MATCDVCQEIKRKLCRYLDGEDQFLSECRLDIHHIQLLRSGCGLCNFLAIILEIRDDDKTFNMQTEIRTDKQGTLCVRMPTSKSKPVAHLLRLEDGNGRLQGRKMADVFDFDLARKWLQCCIEWHGEDCYTPGRPNVIGELPSIGFKVIDVQNRCIVPAPKGCKYVALSYVWGKAQMMQATKDTIVELGQAGALANEKLPRTIVDAIIVVLALSVKYLWIDALCIVQDDADDKRSQIMHMDAIYGHAILTINAAAGLDANHGLPGVSPGSRHIETVRYDMSPKHNLFVAQPLLHEEVEETHWNTRGWTYQERFLSKRALTFLPSSVFFECQRMLWCEDIIAEQPEIEDYFQMENYLPVSWSTSLENHMYKLHYALHVQKSTNWVEYLRTVEEYTPRELSYQSDATNAFSGMNKALGRMFRSEMLFCMPESLFDCALLWQPAESLTRRRAANGQPLFPSWSWPAWKGAVVHEDIMPHLKMLSADLVQRTKPLVKWYKQLSDNSEIVPVSTVGRVGCFILDNFFGDPPVGWRVSTGSTNDIFSDTYFTHEDDPNSFFAVPAGYQTPMETEGRQWPRICGKTQVATILVAQSSESDAAKEYPGLCSLFNASGSWVGSARFDHHESIVSNERFSFLILSEGAVPVSEIERFWSEEELKHIREKDDDWYYFYNVMMVARVDSVFQRLGLGKVDKLKWSTIPSEAMDVVLE